MRKGEREQEQERQNQILFEHAITITARTRIRPCASAHIRMITVVRACTHIPTSKERKKREERREKKKKKETGETEKK